LSWWKIDFSSTGSLMPWFVWLSVTLDNYGLFECNVYGIVSGVEVGLLLIHMPFQER
jgi:hypothetical protein